MPRKKAKSFSSAQFMTKSSWCSSIHDTDIIHATYIMEPLALPPTGTFSPARDLSPRKKTHHTCRGTSLQDSTISHVKKFTLSWRATSRNAKAATSATAVAPTNVHAPVFTPRAASKAFHPKSARTNACSPKSATI